VKIFLDFLAWFYTIRTMARGKRGPIPEPEPQTVSEAQQSMPQETRPERVEATDRASLKRISIPIDERGKINWDSMRASTREETRKFVQSMITDRELATSLGIDKPLIEVFPAEWTGALYDSLGQIEVALTPKILGIAPEIAQGIFVYSPAEKEKLAGPTSKVINKYAADWLIRFKEEIALLMLLGSITYAKVMAAKMAQQILIMKTQGAPKANGKEIREETTVA
jgi:hypothetical protein